MDPNAQAFRCLWIDGSLSHDAPERGLNVLPRAPEPVVEIEVPECRVEVVPPQQADHPAAQPDAFRIARRAADLGRGLREFIDPALRILEGIASLTSLRRSIARLGVAGLSKRA
jgi:hypothetical protein